MPMIRAKKGQTINYGNTPKKRLVVVYNGRTSDKKTSQEKCYMICQIFFLVILTLIFVAVKISCFIMICKFVFQEEENLFGFKVEMFSFTKTFWSFRNITEYDNTAGYT